MRIASLNSLSDPDYILERVTQVFAEAHSEHAEVLALQEVPEELQTQFANIATAKGYRWHHFGGGVAGDNIGIFSTEAFEDTGTIVARHPDGERRFLWVIVRGFLIINAHLTWGAHNEAKRRREVLAIDEFAAAAALGHRDRTNGERELVPILAADCNAEPDNDCLRFLRGKTVFGEVGTYWTEATLGTDLEDVPTTRETNRWGRLSARSRGLDAALLYPRRIDFIFVRGWRHGGRGTLRDTRLFGTSVTPQGFDVSDHFGWITDAQE